MINCNDFCFVIYRLNLVYAELIVSSVKYVNNTSKYECQ